MRGGGSGFSHALLIAVHPVPRGTLDLSLCTPESGVELSVSDFLRSIKAGTGCSNLGSFLLNQRAIGNLSGAHTE